jgi:ATP-dependent helicase/nuclease subunit A
MSKDLHPIVAQLTPNPEQRPAVSARGCDVVVTAGAGTGKTRTLVARYLSLLADGNPLRAIVAITFTRKAAREMRNRVRAEVQRYLTRPDLTLEQRDRWQAVYAGLDAARIGTIHSLCTEILRAHPAEAGVDPRFQVLEEGQTALLRQEVLDAALAWAADEPDVVGLFTLLDGPDRLRGVVQALLQQRLDALAAFAAAAFAAAAFDAVPEDPLARWKDALRDQQRLRLSALLSDPAWVDAVETLRHTVPTDPDDAMARQRRWVLSTIDDVGGSGDPETEPLDAQLTSLSRLDDIGLGGGSYKAWPGGKADKAAVKDALGTLRTLWREHEDLLELELTPLDERLAAALPGLEAVFRFACQRYQAEKRNQRALDFDDLESGAVALLRNHPAVRARWQRAVEAVLVDEFQDTNERQRDLVRLLCGSAGAAQVTGSTRSPGKLFIVGDAKQSIYGFRGADVTVFRAERDRIVGNDGEGWPLVTSYRAHRRLVRALNDLLRPVLGVEDDPRRPWAEPFAPIEPHREDPVPGVEPPYVEFHLAVGSKGDGALDRAARALVGRLAELLEGDCVGDSLGDCLGDSLGDSPLGYGDVAILCRASSSFGFYEDALDEAGVPYVTVAGRGFYERPEIRDLLNALRALSDPTDDLALVGLLRSPALALSDAAVYHLVRARDEASAPDGDGVEPLWDVLRRGEAALGAAAEARAARAAFLVRDLHTMAGRVEVGDLLKAFLDATNYRAALLKAGQQRAVRNVDKLLNDAHASGLVGVGAFLETISGLQDSGAREGEARAVAGGAVQIMSVHQAKGLEFPIVVLGDAAWGGGGAGSGVLADPDLGILLPVKDPEEDEWAAVYRLARAREADRAAAEADRLLYVAATRAREKLFVSGHLGGIKKDNTPYKLGGWLGMLGPPLGLDAVELAYDEEGSAIHHRELRVGDTTVDCLIYEPGCGVYEPTGPSVARDLEPAGTPLSPPLLAPLAQPEPPDRGREPPRRVWRVVPESDRPKAPAWVVGRLVHEALAAWRLPEGRDDDPFARWLRGRARAIGLIDRRQVSHAVRRTRRLLLRFQAHGLFEALGSAERRLHEVPYSLDRDGCVETGQIDLLYRRDGVWTIVEFKTDEVRGRAAFERLLQEKDYVPQARRYAAAAEQLLGTRPRCLLCMLDYAGASRVYTVPDSGSLKHVTF